MKTNTILKQAILGLGALGSLAASDAVAAMPFREGGYVGRLNRDKNIHLMTRRIPGRDGSFMAVLFKKRDEACAYVVDPTEMPGKYAMTPLQVTPDGEVGFNNDNPSLMLTLTNPNPNDPEFTLVNANGGNSACIQGSAVFKGHESRFEWDQAIIPGIYHAGGIRRVATFGGTFIAPGDSSLESSAVSLTRPFKRPGDYAVREKAPGIFTLKVTGYTATGITEEKAPSYLGFSASTIWGTSVYLINPADHTDVLQLNAENDRY